MRTAYALVFKDGEPFINSISHSKKKTIKLAKDYFGLSWKEIKNTGMRCVEVDVRVVKKPCLGCSVWDKVMCDHALPLKLDVPFELECI